MSVYYWQRAVAAVERRRLELVRREIPEEEGDPVWREIDQLTWLEQFARTSLHMTEEAEIF